MVSFDKDKLSEQLKALKDLPAIKEVKALRKRLEQDGKIKYTFEMTKVGTLKENLLKGTFDNIGKFSKVTRDLDINADRGRFWLGRLTDVRKKETNYSTPFSFPEFSPDEI